MKLALGIYTQLFSSSPMPSFDRALELMYEPVLYFLFNNPNYKISLYQSSAMMKHINSQRPEFKSLIASAAKRGDIELISGSYSQTVLSLIPPKDRTSQIEKMTNQIKRDYGVMPSIAFMYGQIWSPLYITTLKNCGIDGVVISTYKATNKEHIASSSFMMNELGKRVSIYSIEDQASALVSRFAQNEISKENLEKELCALIDGFKGENLVLFLNIDQLLEGASRSSYDDVEVGKLVVSLMERYKDSLVHLEQMQINTPGYLDSGWYGRDAWATGLKSFNDIFVRNENFRYLFNRYVSLSEGIARNGSREIKKMINRYLFDVSTGSLFIHDTQCTPMRLTERRSFWGSIIDADSALFDEYGSISHKEYDLEEIGENDYFATNKQYTAVLSPKGGAICEFDYKDARINIMDTRVVFDKDFSPVPLLKSFSDTITAGDDIYSTENRMFKTEILDRKRTDYQFTLEDASLEFNITKHFRLRSSTFICDISIENKSNKSMTGTYSSNIYLDSRDLELSQSEQRKQLFAKKVVQARTVRYNYKANGIQIVFSSTQEFALAEENASQSQYTTLGLEEFFLYKKLIFSFPMDIAPNEKMEYRLILRINEAKESSNVH